jgi:hypothetical protein
MMALCRLVFLPLALILCAPGCIDGKTRDDGSAGAEGGPGRGPGPYGALPNGYCCTAHEQCRDRRCVDHGGGKMCADRCFRAEDCGGPAQSFQCLEAVTLDGGAVPAKRCAPVDPSAACIPADTFVLGQKATGSCCDDPTECLGGHCISLADGPFLCLHACQTEEDCPFTFRCARIDNMADGDLSLCIPQSTDRCK